MITTIINSCLIGFKIGYYTPTLPEHNLNLHKHPIVFIFRILGGISLYYLFSKIYVNHNIFILYVSICISTNFFFIPFHYFLLQI